ncbi:phospholipid-translocating P-type ATPase [Colletotrichum graminicola]|uniref:Phospholipid-transporting ATPase n=1 Tax=Colletotrichum graminicola (strain M1.001 / M2 / FGSC 10212) TaxID=645133 RepID=E3QGA1_COLGM|nr:phospholipid-translocating P-type ATPase [Colletotrichum graminicola M1.001]EFQ29697.1 phospholipid-translocating P-type ATPase [Colletotrichum graminicola M1.001]WDK12544.1 phospholipid-translocating P-type ATPase [Colletotrichum graminicola]
MPRRDMADAPSQQDEDCDPATTVPSSSNLFDNGAQEDSHDLPQSSVNPAHRPAQRLHPRRAVTDPMGSKRTLDGGYVRFSDDLPRDFVRGFDPDESHPNMSNPGLYTIPSRGNLEGHLPPEPSSSRRARPNSDQSFAQPSDTDLKYPVYRPEPTKRTKWRVAKELMSDQLKKAYNVYIVQGLLRQKPLPPSADGRHIPLDLSRKRSDVLVDERTKKPYASNFIRSSRYTIWSFLPKQLLFQFSKMGNFYFLLIGIIQAIPGLSTTGQWTTIAPLAVFVFLSMAKEGYDDYRRYLLAKTENLSRTWVLGERSKKAMARMKSRKGLEMAEASVDGWTEIEWQDLKVGDVVRLRRDDDVPADIVLLHATGPNGTAYIETMALDGETNLKAKRASPILAERCQTVEGIKSCQATIVSEDPNMDLYRYDGRVTVKEETLPLSLDNVIYRGSTVRNTTEVIGIVVNSGEECKIRMNSHKHVRTKAPAMQRVLNRIVIWLIFVLLALSSGLTLGYYLWSDPTEAASWYLMGDSISMRKIFIAFILMFNTLIPLSLYISLEIIKIIQFYMMGDVEMYDPVTNTPMVANTTTILEDLGQVNYVFSDKTGTLTENVMRFRKMSVAGTAWLHDMDIERDEHAKQKLIEMARKKRKGKGKDKKRGKTTTDNEHGSSQLQPAQGRPSTSSYGRGQSASKAPRDEPELKTEDLLDYLRRKPDTAFSKKAKQFLLCIALCHTCLPEAKEDGKIDYQAASPDELALVEAARDLGYLLIDRPAQSVVLQLPEADGTIKRETYQVLDVIEFSSQRKRMSIIIRMPDGKVCVFCKGADNVILPRLKLGTLATQKANEVNRRASVRRSVEKDKAQQQRLSTGGTPRNSFMIGRTSVSDRRSMMNQRISGDIYRRSSVVNEDPEAWSPRRGSADILSPMGAHDMWSSPRHSTAMSASEAEVDELIDETIALNEGAVFERCFQHLNDFASDGLRTLLYGYRYISEDEYSSWRKIYQGATTSLDNRQEKIEAAGELIEDKFDLAGATAIEDRLQEGVPDTIDKLRRAEIKVWMLTGDKRETAINIGHSAGLCKPFSDVFVLDVTMGNLQDSILSTLGEVSRGMALHSVVVVDGQTLSVIEGDEDLSFLFFDLMVRVDSVICCRASPSQKASLVKRIRRQVPHSLTLAIGDGANDIGMIQASHVGIGISGREGLQAARISDYAIAQFRFLQRLLFVHGRWNYLRTGKYILATFWKEIVFFLPQAYFQRYTGYTGTSLYENWSLTVFNTFFTSLAVILLGGLEKDLQPETLLRFPELYTYGHKNRAFNVKLYVGWTFLGLVESLIIFWVTWAVYNSLPFDQDTSLYAMGSVPFTVCVVFINIKLMVLEIENKNVIILIGFLISVGGWFLWNIIISASFKNILRIYQIRHAFLQNFGQTLSFWTTMLLALAAVICLELVVNAIRRIYWPYDVDLMQRLERRGFDESDREAGHGHASGTISEVMGSKTKSAAGQEEEVRLSNLDGAPRLSHARNRPSFHQTRHSRMSREEHAPRLFTPPVEEVNGNLEAEQDEQKPPKKPRLSLATKWLGSVKDTRTDVPIELQSAK